MDRSEASLLALYVAGLLGLGYGLRQIIDASGKPGIGTDAIYISGGAGKSRLVRQLLADASGIPVAVTKSPEPVLLGSPMLGATAAAVHRTLDAAMTTMAATDEVVIPNARLGKFHSKRYDAFRALRTSAEDIRQTEQND